MKIYSAAESDSAYFENRGNYIYLRYKDYSAIDIDEAKVHAKIVINLCNGVRLPFIIDGLNTDSKFTKQARDFFTSYKPLLRVRSAQAYLINTVLNRFLFRFFIKFHKPIGPIKAFSNLGDAEKWIKQFKPKDLG